MAVFLSNYQPTEEVENVFQKRDSTGGGETRHTSPLSVFIIILQHLVWGLRDYFLWATFLGRLR